MRGCKPLSEKEIKDVEKAIAKGDFGKRNLALFLMGRFTGLRISELLSLKVADVVNHGKIADSVTVKRCNTKKKLEGKTLPLHKRAKKALEDYLTEGTREGADYLFKSREDFNRPITRVQAYRIIRQATDSCRISGKVGTHTMRKTFANQIHESCGRDLAKTQAALGHKNIASTICYLSFDRKEIDAAILGLK